MSPCNHSKQSNVSVTLQCGGICCGLYICDYLLKCAKWRQDKWSNANETLSDVSRVMSTNAALSVKYVTLSVALMLVCLFVCGTQNWEKIIRGPWMPQGSSVTHQTGHGLKDQSSILPSCWLFPYKKMKGWKYKNRLEDNIKIGLYKWRSVD